MAAYLFKNFILQWKGINNKFSKLF